MAPEQQRLTSAERSNLVAYLDGELPEPEARALEIKLTQSVSGRREVESLQRTWELLEYLPRVQAPAEFTARTITLATGQAGLDDRLVHAARRALQHAAKILAGLVVAAVTVFASYAATRWLWPDPTARLARDLSIAEYLDAYREVGSFDFLRQLDESPEFNDLATPTAGMSRPAVGDTEP
jgi:anti-sigma factor RsiW